MTLQQVIDLVEGRVVTENYDRNMELEYAMASDLMSDVLTLDTEKTLLITGLTNIQTIRTAEMSDVHCVILARKKRATPEMITLAQQHGIVIVESNFAVYRVSGILYTHGIKAQY